MASVDRLAPLARDSPTGWAAADGTSAVGDGEGNVVDEPGAEDVEPFGVDGPDDGGAVTVNTDSPVTGWPSLLTTRKATR